MKKLLLTKTWLIVFSMFKLQKINLPTRLQLVFSGSFIYTVWKMMLAFKIMFLWFSITETRTHDISKMFEEIQIKLCQGPFTNDVQFFATVFDLHVSAWLYNTPQQFKRHCTFNLHKKARISAANKFCKLRQFYEKGYSVHKTKHCMTNKIPSTAG